MSKFQRDRFQEDREQYYRRNEYYRENPRASSAHRRDQTREDEVTPPVPEKTTSSSLMTMSVVSHNFSLEGKSTFRSLFGDKFPIPLLKVRAASFFKDFKTYVDQACKAAEEFINIYYETMDKRRRALIRLYLNEATLVWNGNVVTGLDALNKFFEMLPSSEFQINMLDCQPVHEQATQSQATVLVVTSGIVKFDGNKQHYFNQNFLLTAQATPNSTVWKIASDCFRFQDWANS